MKDKFHALNLLLGLQIFFHTAVLAPVFMMNNGSWYDPLNNLFDTLLPNGEIFSWLSMLWNIFQILIFYGSFVLLMASWGYYVYLKEFCPTSPPKKRTLLFHWLCISQIFVSLFVLFVFFLAMVMYW